MKKWDTKLLDEFKAFALKGNMVDLAIGVIIGTAFSKVVGSLVSDLIMPPLGLLLGGIDFSDFSLKLRLPGSTKEPVDWAYGDFINSLFNFFIISVVIFGVVKAMNRLRGIKPEKGEKPSQICPECLMSIPMKAVRCCHCCTKITEDKL